MKKLLLCALLLPCIPLQAQEEKPYFSGPSVEGHFSRYASVSAGYSLFYYCSFPTTRKSDTIYNGFFIVTDLTFGAQFSRPVLYTPSLSVKFCPYFIGNFISRPAQLIAGAEYVHYTDFRGSSPVLRPTIGLCILAGGAEISYGYNYRLGNSTLPVGGHAVTAWIRLAPLFQIIREAAAE